MEFTVNRSDLVRELGLSQGVVEKKSTIPILANILLEAGEDPLYIARRLVFGALTVLGVSITVFVIMRVLPGDPLVAIFGPDGFTKLTEEQRASFMRDLGLSDPLWMQYLAWAKSIIQGNFGRSFFRAESVADMLLRRGPITAEIAILSVLISWLVGIPVAIVSALRPNTAADSGARFLSILFLAVPGFWVGMLIVLGLLFWFGYRAPLTGAPLFVDPKVNFEIVIGPAIVLGLGQAAYIARMGRSALLEVIREDYVRTARAKGLSGKLVIAWHALPNALLPVITLSGVLMGLVLAGSIPVERYVEEVIGVLSKRLSEVELPIEVTGRLTKPDGPHNPGERDYRAFLLDRQITAELRVKRSLKILHTALIQILSFSTNGFRCKHPFRNMKLLIVLEP